MRVLQKVGWREGRISLTKSLLVVSVASLNTLTAALTCLYHLQEAELFDNFSKIYHILCQNLIFIIGVALILLLLHRLL